MNGIIRVSASTLRATSADFRVQSGNIKNLMDRMMEISTSLSSVWEGQAAQEYVTRLRCLDEDFGRLNTLIQEYSRELEEIAAQYQLVDDQNIEEILALPDCVIE